MKYSVIYQESQKIIEFEIESDYSDSRLNDEIKQTIFCLGGTLEKQQYLNIQKIESEG